MDDEELIKQFIRAERGEDAVEIAVSEIEWPTPTQHIRRQPKTNQQFW